MPLSLRKLPKNVFERKIKQILFEILASDDCYIDLPVIIQKVKSVSLVYRRSRCKLPFVIPLVY